MPTATVKPKRIAADVPQAILDEINTVDWSRVPLDKQAQVKDRMGWAIKMLGLPTKR